MITGIVHERTTREGADLLGAGDAMVIIRFNTL
jgi:hypothetical protein